MYIKINFHFQKTQKYIMKIYFEFSNEFRFFFDQLMNDQYLLSLKLNKTASFKIICKILFLIKLN